VNAGCFSSRRAA